MEEEGAGEAQGADSGDAPKRRTHEARRRKRIAQRRAAAARRRDITAGQGDTIACAQQHGDGGARSGEQRAAKKS